MAFGATNISGNESHDQPRHHRSRPRAAFDPHARVRGLVYCRARLATGALASDADRPAAHAGRVRELRQRGQVRERGRR